MNLLRMRAVYVLLMGLLLGLAIAGWKIVGRSFDQQERLESTRRMHMARNSLAAAGIVRDLPNKLVLRSGAGTAAAWQAAARWSGTRITQQSLQVKKLPADFASVRHHTAPTVLGMAGGRFAWYEPLYNTGGRQTAIVRIETMPTYADERREVRNLYLVLAGLMLTFFTCCYAVASRAAATEPTPAVDLAAQDDAAMKAEIDRMRREYQESEQLFRQIAINASDVLYAIYPDSGRIDWYGQIDLLLGYAHGSFPRTIEAWAESIHPDEAEHVIELYSQACTTGDPFAIEYRMRHRNGSYRDWSHRGKPLFDKNRKLVRVIGACSDVTERRRAERRLRESEERLARIFETAADAIVLCDRSGVVTFANPAAENIFGVDRKEIVGVNYGDARWHAARPDGTPLETAELPPALVAASGSAASGIEHSVTHPSGRIVMVSVNAALLHDAAGEQAGCVLSLTDITGRKAAEERLAFQAFHDPLTKLPNRALFTDRLNHALVRAARSHTQVAVFFIDLDNFKRTNDTLGHDAGDELLMATASRISDSIRGGDTAARLGGDEFTILLENITEVEQAQVVADRVLHALVQAVSIKGQDVFAPPSIGIALARPDQSVEQVMADADAAMYMAKKNGKSRYEFSPAHAVATH